MSALLAGFEGIQLLFGVQLIAGTVHGLLGVALFLARHKVFPLSGRDATLVTIFGLSVVSTAFWDVYNYMFTDSCSWMQVFSLASVIVIMNIIFLRVYRLWLKFYASTERLRDASSSAGDGDSFDGELDVEGVDSASAAANPNCRTTKSVRRDSFSISMSRSMSMTSDANAAPKVLRSVSAPSHSGNTMDTEKVSYTDNTNLAASLTSKILGGLSDSVGARTRPSSMANTPRSTSSGGPMRKNGEDLKKLHRVETLRRKVINHRKSTLIMPKPVFTMKVHNPELQHQQDSGANTPMADCCGSHSGVSTPRGPPLLDEIENPENPDVSTPTATHDDHFTDPMSRTVPLSCTPTILTDASPLRESATSPHTPTPVSPRTARRRSSHGSSTGGIFARPRRQSLSARSVGSMRATDIESLSLPPLKPRRQIPRAATVRVKSSSSSRPSSPAPRVPFMQRKIPRRVATSLSTMRGHAASDPHPHPTTITTVTTTTVTQETTIRLAANGASTGAAASYSPDLKRIASEREVLDEKFHDDAARVRASSRSVSRAGGEVALSILKHGNRREVAAETTSAAVGSSSPSPMSRLKTNAKAKYPFFSRAKPKPWFVKRRRYARTWFLLLMILLSSVLVFGVVFAPYLAETRLFMLGAPMVDLEGTCSWIMYSSWIARASSGIAILLVMYTALKIRMLTDGYWIKGEFKLLAIFGTFIMLVTLAIAAPEDSATFNFQGFLRWFGFQGCLAISLDYPIFLTFKHSYEQYQRKRLRSGADSQASNQTAGSAWRVPPLEEILLGDDCAALREDFKAHLVREFCIENYLFFNASYNFEYRKVHSESDEHLARSAVKIYYEFIREDSPSQVNVEFSERKAVETALRKCIRNFDEIVQVCSSGGTTLAGMSSTARGVPSFESFEKVKAESLNGRRGSVSVAGGSTKLRLLTGQTALVARHLYNTRLELACRPPANVFAECRATVYQLLETNTFRRWKAERNTAKLADMKRATEV